MPETASSTSTMGRNSLTVHAIVDDALSPDFPLGVELALFTRHEDAERFIEEVRGEVGAEAVHQRPVVLRLPVPAMDDDRDRERPGAGREEQLPELAGMVAVRVRRADHVPECRREPTCASRSTAQR